MSKRRPKKGGHIKRQPDTQSNNNTMSSSADTSDRQPSVEQLPQNLLSSIKNILASRNINPQDVEIQTATIDENGNIVPDENGNITLDEIGNTVPDKIVDIPDGYHPDTQCYYYCGQEYHEGDIIWEDIGPDEESNFVVNIYPEELEEFIVPLSVDHLDYQRPRLPLELDYRRIRQEAATRDCPTCVYCCRHGHIYSLVQTIYDKYLVPTHLLKVFNAICCQLSSPRFYTSLTAEINGSILAHLPVRYAPGMIIDWHKEYYHRRQTGNKLSHMNDMLFLGTDIDIVPLDPYANLEDACLAQLRNERGSHTQHGILSTKYSS